jgi:hypothetical protein
MSVAVTSRTKKAIKVLDKRDRKYIIPYLRVTVYEKSVNSQLAVVVNVSRCATPSFHYLEHQRTAVR